MTVVTTKSTPTPGDAGLSAPKRLADRVADLGPAAVALLGWMVLISLGHLTFFTYPFWTSRLLVIIAVVPIGAWFGLRLAIRGDPTARAIAVFLGALAVATLASPSLWNSVLGTPGSTRGIAFFLALSAIWSLGRVAPQRARELAGPVLVLTLMVHLAFGLLQILLQIDWGPLATFNGRAAGLATNAVYFGTLVTLGVVLAGRQVLRSAGRWWTVALVACVFGVSLSGSRIALAAAMVAMVWASVVTTERRLAPTWTSVATGLVLAHALSLVANVRNSLERGVSRGADRRSEVWVYGWEAFVERPILGWGPDHFRTAIESRLSDDFVTAVDVPGRYNWSDPHNLVVLIATTSGLVGLVGLVLVIVSMRRLRGDMAAGAAAIALTWLFQPLSIVTAPVVVFFLGLAAQRNERTSFTQRSSALRGLIAVGVIMAVAVAFLDLRVKVADSLDEEAAAWRWYQRDPVVATRLADRYITATLEGRGEYADEAMEWAERAVDYQPEQAEWWAMLASRRLILGDTEGAEGAVKEALARQPNQPQAWLTMRVLAQTPAEEQLAHERVCTLVPGQC